MTKPFPVFAAVAIACMVCNPVADRVAEGQTAVAGSETAIVRGRVISTDGRPLRRAAVTLISPSGNANGPSTNTNAQGQFELRGVAPGRWGIFVLRSGYLPTVWGRQPLHPREVGRGSTIEVQRGQSVENITVTVPRGAVLIGRVLDETGRPFPDARVIALEYRYVRGRLQPFPGGGLATTDANGEYRLYNIFPGHYTVAAYTRETWPSEDRTYMLSYGYTYYPGVDDPGRALPIMVMAGVTTTNLDIQLSPSRAARISGRVQDEQGRPVTGTAVNLQVSFAEGRIVASGFSGGSTNSVADGTFALLDVPPGDYQIGGRTLAIRGEDVADVVIGRRSGSTVSGMIVTEPGTTPSFNLASLSVTSVPGDGPVVGAVRVQQALPDGFFSLANMGGPMVFRLTGLPPDWMIKRVSLNGKEISDVPFDVPTGGRAIDGLEIEITNRIGRIRGTVTDAQNAPAPDAIVVIFADDPRHWTPDSRFIRVTRPDADGSFDVIGLPAGSYRAVARTSIVEGQWLNREFLEREQPAATQITVAEGTTATIHLRAQVPR